MPEIRRISQVFRNRKSNSCKVIFAIRHYWNVSCLVMTRSCISRPNRTTTIPSPILNPSSQQTWKARSICLKPPASMTCDSTTSAPTKCTATSRSTIHANSPKVRRISRQAHTVRRKRHLTSWCAHGFARTGFVPRSPTVPTITGRTSMWKNLFRGRSLPSWRACDRNYMAQARTCVTGSIRKTTLLRCGRFLRAGGSVKHI